MTLSETILSTIPGDSSARLVVMLVQTDDGSHMELRQQSWGGDGVEWFTQNSIRLESDQVAALKATLGVSSGVNNNRQRLPQSFGRLPKASSWEPRIVRADSA
ncbi:hypothetical protein [Lignipirellula cremea]|uniref:Uncharacterized protein n=1 Tax=Lignipirellula cremea TaxID=2528010 RepID=A0A518DPG1_9BACT|nr:hypothetical protein [Lignipirellula cremea]QDU93737.1 hypothetical protein Pla8534_15200 [Lignipirellula cremea]